MLNAIGIPLFNDEQRIGERNDSLLKAGFIYGVPVYVYCISSIQEYIQNGVIEARCWENGSYHSCKIDFPKYTEIYCDTSGFKRNFPEQFKWLSEHTVLTDTRGLGKLRFQTALQASELCGCAIPTIPIRSYAELMASVKNLKTSFLKPAGGRKAKGAMKLTFDGTKILYATPENSGELSQTVFEEYYAAAGYESNMLLLLEPCLNILNDYGRAVDFRCIVSLNGEGKWQNVLTYARIGGSDVASNFSHGGSLNFAEDVLEELIPGHGAEKLKEINEVALKAAVLVQRESGNPVSWLGLDICVDRPSNQVYIIEANSKPGTKLVGPWPLALVRAQYFKYLLSQEE